MLGYMGKILKVDLSTGKMEDHVLESSLIDGYLGGRGIGIRLLLDENPVGVDPLSPENRLIFMTGPYTGTIGPFSAFYNVTTKSPLTGAALSSHSGGIWGPYLKQSGYDGILIKGKSERPVYLVIDDGEAKLVSASDIWGLSVDEATDIITEGFKGAVAAIGPAGENRVLFAAILNEKNRAIGRGGAGAVMGSKNLKAIVVRGTHRIEVADEESLRGLFMAAKDTCVNEAAAYGTIGTALAVTPMNRIGGLPTKNFQEGYFPGADKITGQLLDSEYTIQNRSCYNCPLHCSSVNMIKSGKYAGTVTEGPEWETIMAFGSNCFNDDIESIIEANYWCNHLGMDTITMGDTIALAMELYEKNLITESDIGFPLEWGDSDAIVALVKQTGRREGFGDELADGSVRLAAKHGYEAIAFRGMEPPGYEPRAVQGQALSFATSPRGACHLRGAMYILDVFTGELDRLKIAGKEEILKDREDRFAVMDALLICKLGVRNAKIESWEALAETLSLTTGVSRTTADLMRIGERIWEAEMVFNEREGVGGPAKLPARFLEPQVSGPSKGARIDKKEWEQALIDYYKLRGRKITKEDIWT